MKKSVFLFNIIVILLALFVNVYSEDIFFYKAYISDSKIIYNENEIEFESPVVTIDNQTYIPLREVAEKMDISVDWNGEDHRIVLTKNSDYAAREIFNNLFVLDAIISICFASSKVSIFTFPPDNKNSSIIE